MIEKRLSGSYWTLSAALGEEKSVQFSSAISVQFTPAANTQAKLGLTGLASRAKGALRGRG